MTGSVQIERTSLLQRHLAGEREIGGGARQARAGHRDDLVLQAGHDGSSVAQHKLAGGHVSVGRRSQFELGDGELRLERLGLHERPVDAQLALRGPGERSRRCRGSRLQPGTQLHQIELGERDGRSAGIVTFELPLAIAAEFRTGGGGFQVRADHIALRRGRQMRFAQDLIR